MLIQALKTLHTVKDHNLFSLIPYKSSLIKFFNPKYAFAYYRNHRINLLTGEKNSWDFNFWIEENRKKILDKKNSSFQVIHLFYELGFLIEGELQLLNDEDLLAIDIEFSDFKKILLEKSPQIKLTLKNRPSFDYYKKAFDQGYEELVKGNCYQFNLTFPYEYQFESIYNPLDFVFSLWREPSSRGAFASATYIPYFEKLFLSNSPECLFQHKNHILSTMPIKGTLKRLENENWKPLWKKLTSDKKSQAELYMITDLLRNDLSRIEFPRAQIVKKKFPKLVPGLLHQYSQVDVELSDRVNLWQVIEKVFPGGSITGAPKVRAMKLIHKLEERERGFYCGSTVILYGAMKSASLNIRSSVVDFKRCTLHYQAGGGITLLSQVEDEFQEMTYKHDSFIRTLTL